MKTTATLMKDQVLMNCWCRTDWVCDKLPSSYAPSHHIPLGTWGLDYQSGVSVCVSVCTNVDVRQVTSDDELLMPKWLECVINTFIVSTFTHQTSDTCILQLANIHFVFTSAPNTHTTILWPSWILSRTTRVSWHQKGKTRKVKPILIYWSTRYWVAVASTEPYANLHLNPDT